MSTAEVDPSRLDPSVPPAPTSMGHGTLARRLVLQVVALVTLVAVLLSAATTLTVRQLLVGRLDDQLSRVVGRGPGRDSPGRPAIALNAWLNTPGQPIGTMAAIFNDSGDSSGAVLREGGDDNGQLSAPELAALQEIASGGTRTTTVTIGGLGHYRISVNDLGSSVTVAGLLMTDVDDTLGKLIGTEAALALLAMGGAALGARTLIGSSLRPLNRLRNTANQVSRLELDRGNVDLSVRVPPEDTDPRSEVGQVGIAFNHMLGNVAGALAVRQSSERKLSQFVADASHELRNPLAAIRGYAELTRRSRSELPPDTSFAMARVESEADRMSRLVEDLLLLARLDSGPDLDRGPTDLTETVLNATSDARVAGPDHRWSLSLPPEAVVVEADRHRIHQIVANLLANARTHTPPGTSVEAGLRIEGSEAVISVTDNGPGIPPEIGPSVFERFTRADTSRARADGHQGGGSTGLGLAIVAAVVDAHQGRVWVDSLPGRTQFNVALPLHATIPTE